MVKLMEDPISILHLEDDPLDAELVQATLESAGILCKITRVQSADEFSHALETGGYDLVLADYRLPGYNGVSALRFAQAQYSHIPFIFVSGTLGEDAAIDGLTQGATDYVLKNKLARLIPALQRALNEAENQRKRKQAEEALRESEWRYREVFDNVTDALFLLKVTENNHFQVLEINPASEILPGVPRAEIIGKLLEEIIPEEVASIINATLRRCVETGQPLEHEEELDLPTGHHFFHSNLIPARDETGRVSRIIGIARNITERKRAEQERKQHELEREAVITVSNALRKAMTRMEILTVLLDQLRDLFDADGSIVVLPGPVTGDLIVEMGRGTVGERFTGLNIPANQGISGWVIENKQPYLSNSADIDTRFYRPDLLGDFHCIAAVPLIAKELAIGALWIVRRTDLTERDLRLFSAIADIAANALRRVTLHEQTEQQLRHLLALHQIDLAISTNFDLNVTFNVILNNVKDELDVNAASILLLNPVTHTLDYAAGTGFGTPAIEQSRVKLGDGCAGKAAREYRIVSCANLKRAGEAFSRASLLAEEKFETYYAAPLMFKGQVKGVLELFHRKSLAPEQEWINYFETLATQAAIAIESASLFENLQRSNTELMLAYDATIEGWSRALDLRDRETEGHTQRVTEMVLELAEKTDMSDTEKLDLRRGALLHDIGKMGVPDSILFKSGPLSESEWEVMQQHPVYAYKMLSPITYLKRALEIPYCHHEKWDGSGYPRGLKGEEIPLSARMFAIVDVFDALTSVRPYRAAWTPEAVYRYLQEQSGKHFDPWVVKIFLENNWH